jgi:putative beta-1,4-xylosyltransferase IRX14
VITRGIYSFFFACRWIIDKPLQITVPAKQIPWPDTPENFIPATPTLARPNLTVKQHFKTSRSSRSRRKSRGKRKHESRVNDS